MRIEQAIALSMTLWCSTGAYGQEVAAPAHEDRNEIVVYGRTDHEELPLPYAATPEHDPTQFYAESYGGRTTYTFRREVLDLGGGAGIEFFRTWSGESPGSRYGPPEERQTRGRLVFRW